MVLLFFRLARRNLMRNKRRTLITGSAIGLGLASLIFVDALVIGMEDNMIQSATASFMGDGQIHHRGFRQTMEVSDTIENQEWVTEHLAREPLVTAFTRRTKAFGMISSPSNVDAVMVVGVDPEHEKALSQVDEAIRQGTYFKPGGKREIIIGSQLADILDVGLGDRVVMTLSQAGSGDLAQEMFRVSGIYHFNIRELDRGMAFIRLDRAQKMLGLGNRVHEIALKLRSPELGRNAALPLWKKYSRFGNEAVGWSVLLPQVEAAFQLSRFSVLLVGIILFGVVALGIINTLFMSLHERMFEFGVLRAVGTRPARIAQMIVLEAGALAVISIAVGIVMALVITGITAHTGINYSGIEFAGVTMQDLIYPVVELQQFLFYPFWVMVFTLVIGLYPAIHAARLTPAEALRKSL